MKKVLFAFLVAGAMAVGLTSCKKDYNCTCNYTFSSTDTTVTYTYPSVKKSDAEDACDLAQTSLTTGGFTNVSCSLD